VTSIIHKYRVASVYNFTPKILFNFLKIVSEENTPLKVIDAIYSSLILLLKNYSLSSTERKIIYSIADLSLAQKSGTKLTKKNPLMKIFIDINMAQSKSTEYGAEKIEIFPVAVKTERNLLQMLVGGDSINPNDYSNYIPILTEYGPELEKQSAKKSRFSMYLNLMISSIYSQDTNQ
jgi:hypothetical protein